jgi:acetyl-CoA carboxylase carboxyl transferase subunit alpha
MHIKELDFEKPIIELEKRVQELKSSTSNKTFDLSKEIKDLEEKVLEKKTEIFRNITAWQRTQIARHPKRPYTLDYISLLMEDFIEIHGDRTFYDDLAIVGGIASFEGQTVVVIGHQKGRDTKENLKRNFGMANPEGYRKALRLMKMAEKFSFPVITFIDTPGAYPGIGAEERGQACAIAMNLKEMASLAVPIVTVVIGEGGSGGALGISVGNYIYVLEYAVYYVCSPEACSSILWRDVSKATVAAELQGITGKDLVKFGVIDGIIPETLGGSHRGAEETAQNIKTTLKKSLEELCSWPVEKLISQRYEKYRKIGKYSII